MNQFIESFFDNKVQNFKLWSKNTKEEKIDEQQIIYQAEMQKINKKNNKTKQRYFVLTKDKLYYLKNSSLDKVRGVMLTKWVRVQYITEDQDREKVRYCIRFIKNMKYCDFLIKTKEQFEEWKVQLSKVFVQSDFHEKFTAVKMIGKGSFARVYLVFNKETKERFAVKAFSKEYLLSQSKGKQSLLNEIEIMQDLQHKNIMQLVELHESKNSIYLVIELLEGGELFQHISSKKALSVKSIHTIMRCLLKGLQYLQKKGIMHRDLKPENMILKNKGDLENNILKIVDFGLSSYCDMEEYLFKRCGTPGYVAPEIINSSSKENTKFCPKVDIFSAGVIFYILVIGKSPFKGKSFQEILDQNKRCQIDFSNEKLQKNTLMLDLMKKMLKKDPEERVDADQALNHEFFKLNADEEEEMISLEQLQEFGKGIKNDMEDGNSFVVRDNVINGNLDTVNETDSNAGITSFKKVQGVVKTKNGHRTSIYKQVLTKNKQITKFQ